MTTRRPYLSALGVLKVTSAVLFFVVPVVAFFAYLLFVYDFTPSMRLVSVSAYSAMFYAVVVTMLAGPRLFYRMREAIDHRHHKEALRTAVVLLVTPVLGAAIAHMFVQYPLNYLLHCTSSKAPVTVVERVIHAISYGRGGCRYNALLAGGTRFYRREVCDLPREVVQSLSNGGTIELSGIGSAYGIEILTYRYYPRSQTQ